MIRTLFPNLNWFHKNESWKEWFVFYPNSFAIEVTCNTNYNHDNKTETKTTIEGKSEKKCFSDIVSGKEISENYDFNCHVLITLEYITNKSTKKIIEATCLLKIIKDEELVYTHNLKLTSTL